MSRLNNPFINGPKLKHGAIPFDKIKLEHFIPALDYAIKEAEITIEKIKKNTDIPTFENSILPLENCSELLELISHTYSNLMSAESNNKFKELSQEISPKLSKFENNMILNTTLFERVKYVYENRESVNINNEQKRLVTEKFKDFTLNGALLDDLDKKKIRKIDEELSKLSPKYSQNTLNAINAYTYFTEDESELVGIPELVKNQASEMAEAENKSGWIFTLQMPTLIPIMQYAENRDLRETLTREIGKISYGGEFDNQKIIIQIVTLRYEKAQILGFKDHAEYTLQKRMAGNSENVMNFLKRLKEVYLPAAIHEINEIKDLAKVDGIEEIQSWDSQYYLTKLKKQKFDLDQEELRPYFKVENVIDGIFKVANLMYGLEFKEINDVPVYHKEVSVFEVFEENGDFLALFYIDLHPRPTKSGGAWMTVFKPQGMYNNKVERPIISIVCNLSSSTQKVPSLLTFTEVSTIFHEFGHALHGILSKVTYSSLASPQVYWDFVELPSQIMENWLSESETLNLFARHYLTDEFIPENLVKKIQKSKKFCVGIRGVSHYQQSILDMAWHTGDPTAIQDVGKFEDKIVSNTRLFPNIEGTNRSCNFGHIFAGGYSAGYYSYRWAEVLDADAFEHFKENGIFNKEIAKSFRENILEKGNTEDPMDLYMKFRGKKPDPNALLRRDGLI